MARPYTPRSKTECTIQRHNGEFCSAPARPGLPFPICTRHAIKLHAAMLDETQRLAKEKGYTGNSPVDYDKVDVERRRLLREQSVVYYVRLPGDVIKIGTTVNMYQRLTSLRVDPDAVLATEPGGKQLERKRHQQFAAERIGQRENFTPSDGLLRWIEAVREKNGPPKITTYVQVDWADPKLSA